MESNDKDHQIDVSLDLQGTSYHPAKQSATQDLARTRLVHIRRIYPTPIHQYDYRQFDMAQQLIVLL